MRRWYLLENIGGRTRTRTVDPLIKSQLLYQLSYAPTVRLEAARIYHPGPALSIRTSVKLNVQTNPPRRLMYMS